MLLVMLSHYMFPNVIPFGGIMCTKIAIPHIIGRVVICYMLCKICLIITHFTTMTFILLGHKNCRCTSLCIVPGVSNIHTIAPVFCIQGSLIPVLCSLVNCFFLAPAPSSPPSSSSSYCSCSSSWVSICCWLPNAAEAFLF